MTTTTASAKVYLQSWDIETTGSSLPGGSDIVFAVGSAVLRVDLNTGAIKRLDSRRWVLSFGPAGSSADDWATLWQQRGYDMRCWTEFWSKNLPVLNSMMTMAGDMYPTRRAMVDSIAAYIAESETKYPDFIRLYDTVGFDVTNLEALLVEHGHRSIFLCAKGWPCYASYLGDVTRAALGISPLERVFGTTPEQRQLIDAHNKRAIPDGLAHTHDPADDALCIAYKWTHYALMLHARSAPADISA